MAPYRTDHAQASVRTVIDRTDPAPPLPPGPADRRARVVVAGHRSDRVTVLGGLGDADPAVRGSALGAAARLVGSGALDPEALDRALVVALADDDPSVRRRAGAVASRAQVGPAVVVALTDALRDPDATVVEVAAFACGELVAPDRTVVRALIAVAGDHRDPLCREAAVAALGSLGDPLGRRAVIAASGDRANVRRRAVLALAAFDGDDVTAALEHLTADRDLQVRQAAEELLAIESGEDT